LELAERHIITKKHPFFNECDDLCFKSKNIYNLALYKVRQEWIQSKSYNILNLLYHNMKSEECFRELPIKVGQATLGYVQQNFKAFFSALKSYNKTPNKFLSRPKLPNYKNPEKGRFITSYNYQAISRRLFKDGLIQLSSTSIQIKTKITDFDSIRLARIVPKFDHYVIEIIYTIPDAIPLGDNKRYGAIDLGLNNLATVTTNTELKPFVINGKPLKSINQFYNKKRAYYLSRLEKQNKKTKSRRLNKLTTKRNRRIDDYMHKASKRIVDIIKANNINILVIGKNDNWKQSINLRKKTNQNFVSIPHSRFVDMIRYKCERIGIQTITREESYTSKCSFLDLESIRKKESYKGKRVKRGMYKSSTGRKINADVNGSYNILRKEVPNAFSDGIEGVVVHPMIITIMN